VILFLYLIFLYLNFTTPTPHFELQDENGAECLFNAGVVAKIVQLMKVEQCAKIRLSLVRVLGNLAKRSTARAKQIVREAGVPFFLNALNSKVCC
jgi:hypothetical protein